MPKKMLIDAAHAEETRVVVLDGTKVEEFDFESRAKKQLRGNIYLAKVIRVEPSLQSAFVEYGGNRHGFLAFNEIHPDYYQIPHADREALLRDAEQDDDDHAPSAPAPAAVDEDGETLNGEALNDEALGGDDEDEIDEEVARRRRRLMRRYKIQEVIKRRQIMLVQVVKEERGNKGAALTTYLSLAGRYCILMPNTDRGGGISRKIAAVTDRKRLRAIVSELDVPQGMGLIVRTAGAKRTKAEIKRDYEYLSRAWSTIRDTTLHSIAPALIYEEEDLVKRAIRDLFDKDIEGVWVEGEAGYREARDFMRMLMPSQAKKVQPWQGPAPLFVAHKIEDHLSQIYSPTVPLKSGGYLVINQTEALVAVDVNSGRATRERNIEATALKTNLEAAEEAARQLRLRDLAGLIVIDFIDMDEAKNNRAVEKVLKDCLARDRARIQMGRISSFGLMELSRQRRRTGILEGTTHVCPTCGGAGRVRSVESSALATLRAVEMEAQKGGGEIVVRVPRDVSLYILNHKREHLTRLLHSHGLFVSVVIGEALAHAEYEIERISDVPHQAERAWEGPSPAAYAETPEDESDGDESDGVEDEADDEDDDEAGGVVEGEAGGERAREREAVNSADDEGARPRRRRRRGRGRDEPRPSGAEAPRPPAAEQTEEEAEGDGARHRRRRGRRGGRRARDEGRAGDVYAWSWPARLSGDDPYEWRGPVETAPLIAAEPPIAAEPEIAAGSPVSMTTSPQPMPPAALEAATPAEATAAVGAEEEIWVELSAEPEKPGRPRRPRARSRAKAASPPEETAPTQSAGEDATAIELPPAPAPVVVLAATREPPTPARSDPAEILTPPAAPKRGWWRRGA